VKNDGVKVSWDDEIRIIYGKHNPNVPKHQPDLWFETSTVQTPPLVYPRPGVPKVHAAMLCALFFQAKIW
jgi:hypothetical protein